MATSMIQIRTDLWETRTDTPFPGLTTHAYLWTAGGRNALFYCPAGDADFAALDSLGGRPTTICPTRTRPARCWPASPSGSAPGCTRPRPNARRSGSTSYLVEGAQGRYLFTGDTMFVAADGRWSTFVIPGIGDAGAMTDSLHLLASLQPDVVISSAYGARAVTVLDEDAWPACVDEALRSIPVTR